MTINCEFVCDLESAAGYAAHARMMVKAFDRHSDLLTLSGINIKVVSRRKEPNVVAFSDEERAIYEKYLNKDIGKVNSRIFFEPTHFATFEEGVKTILFVQWETTRIRDYALNGDERRNWVSQMNKADLVMTSSGTARDAFQASGVTTPVVINSGPIFENNPEVGQLGVAGLVMDQKTGSFLNVADRPIVIGYMAQWSPRKNIEAFIRDVTIAFNGNPNVVGLLKTYSGSKFNDDEAIMKAAKVVRESCKVASPPDIYLVTEKLSDIGVEQFFNTVDIYYCPSRGEGFNVPAAMAAAAGVPVLAGKYGGHSEFLPPYNLLSGSFSPCIGMSSYDSNQFWFNIDEREAITRLRTLAMLRWNARHGSEEKDFEMWNSLSKHTTEHALKVAGTQAFVSRFNEQIKKLFAA